MQARINSLLPPTTYDDAPEHHLHVHPFFSQHASAFAGGLASNDDPAFKSMLINTPATNYTKTKLAGDIVLATALLHFASIFDFDFGLPVGCGSMPC